METLGATSISLALDKFPDDRVPNRDGDAEQLLAIKKVIEILKRFQTIESPSDLETKAISLESRANAHVS
jgi:hypothetical protein